MNFEFYRAVAENHQKYNEKIVLIKAGGETCDDPTRLAHLLAQIQLIQMFGGKVVLVNGGGKQINEEYSARGLTAKWDDDNERDCDAAGLDASIVALQKVTGSIAKLYNGMNEDSAGGFHAVAYNAFDLGLVMAEPKRPNDKDCFTGRVTGTNSEWLQDVLAQHPNRLCIINSICKNEKQAMGGLNVNADFVAAHLAGSLGAERFVMCTSVPALLDANKECISSATPEMIAELMDSGVINGGMVPKVRAAMLAIELGVAGSVILSSDGLADELFTDKGAGTLIERPAPALFVPNTAPVLSGQQ